MVVWDIRKFKNLFEKEESFADAVQMKDFLEVHVFARIKIQKKESS